MFESLAPLSAISPAWPFIAAGLLCFALPWHNVRKALMLLAPTLALMLWFAPPEQGIYGVIDLGPFQLETYRYDGLSRVWGLVFILVGFINAVYALHERARISDGSALIYGGAALGAVFAGDFLTLFLFWEITAIASAPLIFAAGTAAAYRAGLRYLAIQVLSGVLLLSGAVMWVQQTGDWSFNEIGLGTPAGFIILLSFGIKAAFPFMHNWLQDSYPKATPTGAVILSAFTTKMAIYALARGYAGEDILIWIGAIMTAFPVFFAVVENDLRRVLAYSLNNQLGFMIAGIGVGTELGLAGAAAHAFVHIIYKALLFMSMGAVLHRVGSAKATDLGGLYKSMPITAVFCLIGALSISAFPLFSGFVAKALTLSAVLKEGYGIPFLILVFASAGVLEHSGIKIPYFTFFGHDSGKRPKEAPWNMLVAMGLASFLCIFLGVNYGALYALMPYDIEYAPYTFDHIVGQMQLLLAALFAFTLLVRLKLYPLEKDITVLDTDWIYRRFLDGAVRWGSAMSQRLIIAIQIMVAQSAKRFGRKLFNLFSPAGALSRDFPSGLMALWTALMLAMVLLVAYFSSV
ncbi:MAG: Na(+)/H(+) antiporter subunit D [Pseudomonadota bacterium]